MCVFMGTWLPREAGGQTGRGPVASLKNRPIKRRRWKRYALADARLRPKTKQASGDFPEACFVWVCGLPCVCSMQGNWFRAHDQPLKRRFEPDFACHSTFIMRYPTPMCV